MPSDFTGLTVTWFDASDTYSTNAAVTDDLITIPMFTETGSGEVNEAEIVLDASLGRYINTGNIIAENDRFRIQITDLGGNSYDRYFEVIDIIPTQTKSEGSLLTLKCLGIEYHTQVIHYARRHWLTNAHKVAKLIGKSYNDNNGSKQPTLSNHDDTTYSKSTKKGNELARYTNNHYEFGLSEETSYNRWMQVIDALGAAVASGGDGEFYEMSFDTSGVNAIEIALFVSGARSIDGNDTSNDASLTTIKNTTSINLSEQEGGISNPTGSNILAWGSPNHGTLPVATSKYRSEELEFLYRPIWKTGLTYKVNAKILDPASGKHYKASSEHTAGANVAADIANWTQIDMSTEFGDDANKKYSFWTDDKAVLWANGGSAPSSITTVPAYAGGTTYAKYDIVVSVSIQYRSLLASNIGNTPAASPTKWEVVDNAIIGNGCGFFDSNLVVQEDDFFRTWVMESTGDNGLGGGTAYDASNDASQQANYKNNNGAAVIGHRSLNVSDTNLSGTDRNNVNFKDTIIERVMTRTDDVDGNEWVAKYIADSTTDRMQAVAIYDGTTWEWTKSDSKWADISATEMGNDCFHQYFCLCNVVGVDPKPATTDSTKFPDITLGGSPFTQNIRSAVEVVYKFGTSDKEPTAASGYKKGAWLGFAFPFPLSKFNSISEKVGELWGGGTNLPVSGAEDTSFLDFQNMTYSHDAKVGFNQGDSSEDLGPITAVAGFMRIGIETVANTIADGIVTIRCTMYDRNDHVVIQDWEHKFSDTVTWQEFNLTSSGFTIYRARKPKSFFLRGLAVVGFEVPLKERDIHDIFEFRHVKYITFQIQDFYDEEGRYDPFKNVMSFENTGLFTSAGGVIKMAIDGFHFKKTLLATSGQSTTINIEPSFIQRPNIISYNQLKAQTLSDKNIFQFRHKEFNFQTSGDDIFDVRFGDMVFLENADLISDTDDTASGETAKKKMRGVVKRLEYHLTKPPVGVGGITRTVKIIKRFSS